MEPKIAVIGVGEKNTFRTSCKNGDRTPRNNAVVKYLEQTCVVKLELGSTKKEGFG